MKKLFGLLVAFVAVFALASCGHEHEFKKVEAKDATCTAEGNKEYYTCSGCDLMFAKDGDKYVETTLADVTLAKLPHTLTHHEAVDPTYVEEGNVEYWNCSVCGKNFSDKDGKTELNATVLPVLDPSKIDLPEVSDEDPLADYKNYVLYDLAVDFAKVSKEKDNFEGNVYASCVEAYVEGAKSIVASETVKAIKDAYAATKDAILAEIPAANGLYDFSSLSLAERTVLTGIVEEFASQTGLTGITLYAQGSYSIFNERIVLGSENYIPGYGFGTLAEGDITAPLETESNEAWKMYYHTFESKDPATINYWNDKGAEVGDLYSYQATSLFETFMADTKDAYKWVGALSKDERPQPLDEDFEETGESKRWRVEIKTGADGLKYNTNSTLRAAYNGRNVEAADYLTAYKVMLTQSNKLFRGGEAATASGTKIVGIDKYYTATEKYAAGEGQNPLYDEAKWNELVKPYLDVYEENGKWYFEWENNNAETPFFAMYYIASSLFQPIPEDFINEVGLTNLFSYNSDKTQTPVDNSLSLGAYTLESWETDKAIVYKKNPYYVFADSKYKTQGVHIAVLTGLGEDEDLGVKEFLAGKIDGAGLTQNYLKEYKNDPRTRRALGSTNFKLNANTATPEVWEYYFGVDGVVTSTPADKYWDIKAVMSNLHFYRAISFALDRDAIADAHGSVPSISYLGNGYWADAENGLAYNSTKEHKDAIAAYSSDLGVSNESGYSLQYAREYFKIALLELEADGLITRGTPEDPTVITIEIAWMYPYMEETYHVEVKQMLEDAFNDESVHGGCYELKVEFWAGPSWDDVYYKKLMVGQFDIGFGSISGNTYDILDYMTVLSANQKLSGGFTLNWGPNTGDPDQDILLYNGMKWSFDALISAANALSVIKEGQLVPSYELNDLAEQVVVNQDGSWTITLEVDSNVDGIEFGDFDLVAFGDNVDGEDYLEESVVLEDGSNLTATQEGNVATITCTISKDLVDKYLGKRYEGYLGIDIYLSAVQADGTDWSPAGGYWTTTYLAAPKAE